LLGGQGSFEGPYVNDAGQIAGTVTVDDGSVHAVLWKVHLAADTTPPVLTVPSDLTVAAIDPNATRVVFEATASDPDDQAGPVTCTPESGSLFRLGTTTVTCSSTDTHGNTGTASFQVHVTYTRPRR
jgi:hypothetical protein